MTIKLSSRFKTIAVVGYTAPVAQPENRAAHGAVCLLQARRRMDNKIVARKINSNGRHIETSKPFVIDDEQLAHWQSIGR